MATPVANINPKTNTFENWINQSNKVAEALSEIVVTTSANITGGLTEGNAHVEGIFSANTLVTKDGIRGGTIENEDSLTIISNTEFNKSVSVGADSTHELNVQSTSEFTANVFFGKSGAEIDVELWANTTAQGNVEFTDNSDLVAFRNSNTAFVGTNKTVFFGNSLDRITVQPKEYLHNAGNVEITSSVEDYVLAAANVNISSANTVLSGTIVNITSADVTIGDADTDLLDIRSKIKSSVIPNANVSFDFGTTDLRWRNLYIDVLDVSGNTVIGSEDTDDVNFNSKVTSNFVPKTDNAHDLGSSALKWRHVYTDQLTATGNTVIGNADADEITLRGRIISSVIPKTNENIDLGTAALKWRHIYTDQLTATGNTVIGNADADEITLRGRVISNVIPKTNNIVDLGTAALRWKSIFSEDLNVSGNTIIGSATSDRVEFNARVNSNIVPDGNATRDLGSSSLRWDDLYIHDINASGNTTLGSATTDLVSLNARINTNVQPSTNAARDLGSSSLRWRNTYTDQLNVSGNTSIGNAAADLITIGGRFASSIIPNANVAVDLGSTGRRWSHTYTDQLTVSGNTVIGNAAADLITIGGSVNSNLIPNADGSRDLGSSAIRWNNLFVEDTTISGNTSIGGATTDVVSFTARVNSDFIPDTDRTRSLGSSSLKWNLYAEDAIVTGNTVFGTWNAQDRIEFISRVSSNFIPDASGTRDLGSSSLRWDEFYVRSINASDNTVLGDSSADRLSVNSQIITNLIPNGERDLGSSSNRWNDVFAQNLDASGNTVIGSSSSDIVSFNARVNSSFVPRVTNAVDLGSSTFRWRNLYVEDFNLKGTATTSDFGANTLSIVNPDNNAFNVNTRNMVFDSDNDTIRLFRSDAYTGTSLVSKNKGDVDVYGDVEFHNPEWLELTLDSAPNGGNYTVGQKIYGASQSSNAIVREVVSSTVYKISDVNGSGFANTNSIANTAGGQTATISETDTTNNRVVINGDLIVRGETQIQTTSTEANIPDDLESITLNVVNMATVKELVVSNTVTIAKTTTINGNTILNENTFTKNVRPSSNATYNIGQQSNTYSNVFTRSLRVDNIDNVRTSNTSGITINAGLAVGNNSIGTSSNNSVIYASHTNDFTKDNDELMALEIWDDLNIRSAKYTVHIEADGDYQTSELMIMRGETADTADDDIITQYATVTTGPELVKFNTSRNGDNKTQIEATSLLDGSQTYRFNVHKILFKDPSIRNTVSGTTYTQPVF